MRYLYGYCESAALGAGAEGVLPYIHPAAGITVPQGHRAVFRRVDGFSMDPGNSQIYVNQGAMGAANRLWGAVVAGIGPMGGDCYIYVDANAAAIVIVLSGIQTGGGVAIGAAISGSMTG